MEAEGVKKKNRCYESWVLFLVGKSHLAWFRYEELNLFFFSLQLPFLGIFYEALIFCSTFVSRQKWNEIEPIPKEISL